MSKVLAIAQFTLLEALRTRVLWLVLAMLVLLGLGSLFVEHVAITETTRLQTGFLAASARMGVVFVLCLHIASSMVREFNDKGVDLLLSLDLPRAGYFFGKLLGFAGLALVIATMTSLALALLAPLPGVALWGTSLACELILMSVLTLFCIITFVQIMPAVSFVLGFYLLARSIAAVKLLSGSQLLNPNAWTTKLTGWLVDGVATILPDLGRFTQTGWLVNGPEAISVLGFVALQTSVYGVLLVLAGLYDLYRKNL
jgi:ABC-type transport system involved in multi-copper enzyme maturation permease subunit